MSCSLNVFCFKQDQYMSCSLNVFCFKQDQYMSCSPNVFYFKVHSNNFIAVYKHIHSEAKKSKQLQDYTSVIQTCRTYEKLTIRCFWFPFIHTSLQNLVAP